MAFPTPTPSTKRSDPGKGGSSTAGWGGKDEVRGAGWPFPGLPVRCKASGRSPGHTSRWLDCPLGAPSRGARLQGFAAWPAGGLLGEHAPGKTPEGRLDLHPRRTEDTAGRKRNSLEGPGGHGHPASPARGPPAWWSQIWGWLGRRDWKAGRQRPAG